MKCKHCNLPIPEGRLKILPNATTCVSCSNEEKVAGITVVHHKTGHTVEVVKDQETAKEFNRLSSRAGYGSMRGMRSGTSGKKNVKVNTFTTRTFNDNPAKFNDVGTRMMDAYETFGLEKAQKVIDLAVRMRDISNSEGVRLNTILNTVNQAVKPQVPQVKMPKYNPYSKYEPPKEKKIVSEEIENSFKNWRK